MGLVVSPSSGPVGTMVTVQGQGCNNSGSASTGTSLVFQSGQGGTVGAVDVGEVPNDDQGRFRTTVTIPARMDLLQGTGVVCGAGLTWATAAVLPEASVKDLG